MPTLSDRRGATLPLAILAIVIISLTVAAGYARVSSERRISADQQAQVDAFAVAQTGLEQYINGVTSMPGVSDNATITGIPGGSAEISLRRVRDSTSTMRAPLYVVSSRGTSTGSTRYGASTASAQRTVAQYVIWQPGSMAVQAAWTSITGINKSGGSGVISGVDQCGKQASLAGVEVPNSPGYNQTGGSSVPSGSPNIGSLGADPNSAKDQVPIDWDGILNGGLITPDITMPGGSWPSGSGWNTWPIIRYNGDADIPTGKGVLIVTGNATLNGSVSWSGVILVGGMITSSGNNTLLGSVITGLNTKLGMTVPPSDIGSGTKDYEYNSCMIDSALTDLSKFVRIRNAWTDDWPSY